MTSLTHTNKYQSTEHGQSYGTEYASKCAQCASTAFRILHAEFNISIARLRRHRSPTVPAGAKERAKCAKHIRSASITRRRNGRSLLICVDAHLVVASWKSNQGATHTHTNTPTHEWENKAKSTMTLASYAHNYDKSRELLGLWEALKRYDSFVCFPLLLSFLSF